MMKLQIDTSNSRGDIVGGLTAGALSLPLALAFGIQSGMGAIAGLYGAIAIGMVAAWFGGTPSQVSGPTGPMTVVSAAMIATAIETSGSLDAAMGTIIATFMLAGFIQLVLGLTVFVDIFQAIIIGVVMASILFMKKMSDLANGRVVTTAYTECLTREQAWEDEIDLAQEIQQKVFIKHFDGPIVSGVASELIMMLQSLSEVEIVIMRMNRVNYIDQSGVYAIKEAVTALQENNVLLLITGLQVQPTDRLKQVRMIPYLIPEKNLYPDFRFAIKALNSGNDPHYYPTDLIIEA